MRIATWNCFRGDITERVSQLSWFEPEITLLQECAKPACGDTPTCLWDGEYEEQGVTVVAAPEFTITRGPRDDSITHSVFPYVVESASGRWNVIAVWAKPEPTYVKAIHAGLDAYGDFISSGPTIIAGDFNSGPALKAAGSANAHTELCRRLNNNFGLVSGYHAATGGIRDEDPATYYYHWDVTQPYHLDYCFVPRSWANRLLVRIGGFGEYASSDHRPMFVEAAGV